VRRFDSSTNPFSSKVTRITRDLVRKGLIVRVRPNDINHFILPSPAKLSK
jgi:hypothetical protein